MFDNNGYTDYMPQPVEAVLYNLPNDPAYPAWMDHFVAFMRGAVT